VTEPATFSLFVRALPPHRGFVAAGLDDVVRLPRGIRLRRRRFGVDTQHCDVVTLDALRTLRISLAARLGVRLDSGDLLVLSQQTRRLLKAAGYRDVIIVASGGGLDEFGVSADSPSLDTAYRLVEYAWCQVLKLSPGKQSLPGPNQVVPGPAAGDMLATRSESAPTGCTPLLSQVMRGGEPVAPAEPIDVAAERLFRRPGPTAATSLELNRPAIVPVLVSPQLGALTNDLRGGVSLGSLEASRPADAHEEGRSSGEVGAATTGRWTLSPHSRQRLHGDVTETATIKEEWNPEVLVRVYRGGHLIEQRFCESPESVANVVESWEAQPPPTGELIVVEPHPPEVIVDLLRAIADAIEQERPVAMQHPFPHIRLELVTEGAEPSQSKRGELCLLWHELGHPGE
jgi:hypothetical protein